MHRGKIIFFNKKSKFGFIRDHEGHEYYVHGKNMQEEVSENDEVEFEIKIAKRGPEATQVKKINTGI